MKTFAALLLVLLLGLPTPAPAQDSKAYTDDEMWSLASEQLVKTLTSPYEGIQAQALKNTIIYATLYRDKVDLGDAVHVLRRIYEKDNDQSHRKLALAAMQAIGNLSATTYIDRNVTEEESKEGRIVLAAVLNDYYQGRSDAASTSALINSPSSR